MTRKGQPIVRLTKIQIARRRDWVRDMLLIGYRPQEIVNTILANPTARVLLSDQADPLRTIADDIRALGAEAAPPMPQIKPLQELHDYRERMILLMNHAYEKLHEPGSSAAAQARWAMIYMDAATAVANTAGVPTGGPAFQIDLYAEIRDAAWTSHDPGQPFPVVRDPDDGVTFEMMMEVERALYKVRTGKEPPRIPDPVIEGKVIHREYPEDSAPADV